MKAAKFELDQPVGLELALQALAQGAGMARALAGGQSLVPMLNLRLAPLDCLVDLSRITELKQVQDRGDSMLYGAMLRHADFEDGRVPDCANGLMQHAAGQIAYRAVRNRGTIGGAIALADPAADWLTVGVLLDARIHLASVDGKRSIPLTEFVVGPYMTALAENELMTGVEVPKLAPAARWGYYKVMRKTGEYADSFALALSDGARARVVVGAVDGTPLVLAQTAQAVLAGAAGAALAAIVGQELGDAGRDFTPAKILLHRTAVCRAIADLRKK
ncbi:xanthine dehydrogenase family protein subunit M [Lacisediminimonas sp.]|uniref:FAD binding domain-containing protein n=1 Tax=Lacisediminimonas sp. TaxID=3060582 RepID=UPI00271F7677|nr:FAD binding domain-containing protein [Lacisediminimonas sp.]MDO8299630.1 FAD binding domain-containing protein [Lacisediminimonas sp.]